jgi:hypothetical protein
VVSAGCRDAPGISQSALVLTLPAALRRREGSTAVAGRARPQDTTAQDTAAQVSAFGVTMALCVP